MRATLQTLELRYNIEAQHFLLASQISDIFLDKFSITKIFTLKQFSLTSQEIEGEGVGSQKGWHNPDRYKYNTNKQ